MPPTRLTFAIPLLAFAALTSVAQPANPAPPAQDPIPTLHVTTRIVALDVVVTDGHGQPSTNLKPSDFTLTEDGVPQTILSFVEHDATEAPAPATTPDSQLPPNTFTVQQPSFGNGAVTVIVLANVGWQNAPFVRSQIKGFLASSPISSPIAILRWDWQGMHLVQGLTNDRAILLGAASSQRILPPLGFPVRFARLAAPPTLALNRYLAAIPNRINLVWFGEAGTAGQDQGLFADTSGSFDPNLAAFMQSSAGNPNVHRLSRIALYPILAGGLTAPAACVTSVCVENVSYTAGMAGMGCSDAMQMAEANGGKAFCDNGFKEALTEIVNTGSHYYTISYRPTNPNWNGKYRNIEIALKTDRQETAVDRVFDWITYGPAFMHPHILYREGYYARETPPAFADDPSVTTIPSAAPSANTPAAPHRTLISLSPRGQGTLAKTHMEQAMGFGTLTPTQVHFTIVVTPSAEPEKLKPGEALPPNNFLTDVFRGLAYRNCKIHYWIEPQDLHFTANAAGVYEDQIQFVAMVYRDDGLIANSLTYTAHLQIAADQIQDIQANGLTFDQTIAITVPANPGPGNFFLRAGVNELASGHIGALEVPVEWIKPTPPAAP